MTTLHVDIDRSLDAPIHQQICDGLRRAILDGRIRPGRRIPSTRTLAADLGIPARIRAVTVNDLETADELFFSGTAVEVTPVVEVDGRRVGDGAPGPFTRRLQRTFFEVVQGKQAKYRHWLTFASQSVQTL